MNSLDREQERGWGGEGEGEGERDHYTLYHYCRRALSYSCMDWLFVIRSNSSSWHFKKSTSIKQSLTWSGVSVSRVLQIALVPGSHSVNYTIGAVRSLDPGRENPGRVIPRVKDGSSVVGRTNYFTDRYKIAIPRFCFIPYI